MYGIKRAVIALSVWCLAGPSEAKTNGAAIFCQEFANSPHCQGSQPSCSFCHNSAVPERNSYGQSLSDALRNGDPTPVTDQEFANGLGAAFDAIAGLDSDQDGSKNMDEINSGSLPGNSSSKPNAASCSADAKESNYKVCEYDRVHVFKKVNLDFCGSPPSFDEMEKVKTMGDAAKDQMIADALQKCLDSEHWKGKDGVVWQLGHQKIRPVGAVKQGEDGGSLPLVDYYVDYNLFVYTQIDDNDARDVLRAQYTVNRTTNPTNYTMDPSGRGVAVTQARRAGLISTVWNLGFYVMFSPMQRTAAAQVYRAFLGLDLSKGEGIKPAPETLVDYDNKGVTQPACAACHTTLDPLTYPFKNYNGLTFGAGLRPVTYNANRMQAFAAQFPTITSMTEAGYILGKKVNNMQEWIEVAVASDEFAANTVRDYWKILIGHAPTATEQAEFQKLWNDFRSVHNFRVEAMLRDLIRTEAYGEP